MWDDNICHSPGWLLGLDFCRLATRSSGWALPIFTFSSAGSWRKNPLSEESLPGTSLLDVSYVDKNNSIIPGQADMVKFQSKTILEKHRKTFFSSYCLQQHHLDKAGLTQVRSTFKVAPAGKPSRLSSARQHCMEKAGVCSHTTYPVVD